MFDMNAELIGVHYALNGNYSDGTNSGTTPKILNIINGEGGHVNAVGFC